MLMVAVSEFDTSRGAEEALQKVRKPHNEVLLQSQDAAVVSWEPGQQKPMAWEPYDIARAGAASGAPLGSRRDTGIRGRLISEVRENARA
jgi:uncharacterized membrane protein